MCDRYSIACNQETLSEVFQSDPTDNYKQRYNAAPSQILPVITSDTPKGFSYFYWGISPEWSKNKSIAQKIYNVPSADINKKPSLRIALNGYRCLIPADGFYLWKQIGKKRRIPYRFSIGNNEAFAIAGIWEEFEDENDEVIHTFKMIITAPNAMVAEMSPSMPVILKGEQMQTWLNQDTPEEQLLEMLTTYDQEDMSCYTVSPRIEQLKNDGPSLLQPTPPADQFGNYSLFD